MERLVGCLTPADREALLNAARLGPGEVARSCHDVFDGKSNFSIELQHLCIPHEAMSAKKAELDRFKSKGTQHFASREEVQALASYSEALRHAGLPSLAKEAAKLYHNRALCILKVLDSKAESKRLFEENQQQLRHLAPLVPPSCRLGEAEGLLLAAALANCDEAVRLDPKYDKAHFRRAVTLERLGRSMEALESALVARQLNASAEVQALVERIEKLEMTPGPREHAAVTTVRAPTHTKGTPDAEDGLAARGRLACCLGEGALQVASTSRGRELQACSPVPQGRDLYVEKPWTFVLTREARGQHCDSCLRPLTPLCLMPCCNCSVHAFCSAACREKSHGDRSPYRGECGLAWTVVLPPWAVLAGRAALREILEGRRIESSGGAMERDRLLTVRTLEAPFTSLSEDPENLLRTATLARVLSSCVEATLLQEDAPLIDDGQLGPRLTETILLYILRVRGNGVAIVPREKRSDSERLALALYPLTSTLNHGCKPNVHLAFEGVNVRVRSVRPLNLAQGEPLPLAHSYGPEDGAQPTALRRAALLEQYGFTCSCSACLQEECARATKEAELWGFLCPHCREGAVPPDFGAWCMALPRPLACEMIEPESVHTFRMLWQNTSVLHGRCKCSGCARELGEAAVTSIRKVMEGAWRDFCEAEEFASSETSGQPYAPPLANLRHAEEKFQDALEVLSGAVHRNHRLLGYINHRLMKIHAAFGDRERVMGYGLGSLKALQAAFDERVSPQIAYHKLDLARELLDLDSQSSKGKKASAAQAGAGSQWALQLQVEGETVLDRLFGQPLSLTDPRLSRLSYDSEAAESTAAVFELPADAPAFVAAERFEGGKQGYVF